MTAARFELLQPPQLAPYLAGLRALEREISYPISGDRFWIDHGELYHPFFSALGDAYFLLALRDSVVVGSVTGVVRDSDVAGRRRRSLYICDLKVRPVERGTGLASRLLRRGLVAILQTRAARSARLLYGAAMKGDHGDVMRSARGLHPLRLGGEVARLAIFFVPAHQLARLVVDGCPRPPSTGGLVLSVGCDAGPAVVTTAGRKDLRLASTGSPWPLVHLPRSPRGWGESLAAYLRACGEHVMSENRDATCCFALDERLVDSLQWLGARGLRPGATCRVLGLSLGLGLRRRCAWVHLASSEI